MRTLRQSFLFLACACGLAAGPAGLAQAQVLPDDRLDVLYHSYEGDNVEITGPSILGRKKLGTALSVYANYYVDSISSASIDVLSYASPYEEERTEYSLGADYILGEAIVSAGFTTSSENDFDARTLYLGISQEIFSGLTTVNLSFARGDDEVKQITDPDFLEEAKRRLYRVGVSQVITKNFLMNFDFEAITDEGYLNNPYRQVRFEDPGVTAGYRFQREVYPETRSSNAFALGGRYFLQRDRALYGNARIYDDTWGIRAWNAELGYVHTWRDLLFDVSYRFYTQGDADFFSDLFPFEDAQNFLARDKELSDFESSTVRADITWDIADTYGWSGKGWLKRGTLNLSYSLIRFDYNNFRDIVTGGPVGEEPFFSFDADVYQLYFSVWF